MSRCDQSGHISVKLIRLIGFPCRARREHTGDDGTRRRGDAAAEARPRGFLARPPAGRLRRTVSGGRAAVRSWVIPRAPGVRPCAVPARPHSSGDPMTVTDELLASNKRYAESFTGPLPLPPSRHVAVLACMDARLDVYRALGLDEGEAHVIRNAGGGVTDDEIRSLAISQRLLGTTEIVLIHHTDCGMLTFTDEDFRTAIEQDTGVRPDWHSEAFSHIEDDVRTCMKRITDSPFIPDKSSVRGFVFDVAAGKLSEVV